MSGVMTRKEYLHKKKSQPLKKPVKVSGAEAVKVSAPDSFLSDTDIVLQDPDLKTYEDKIVLDGRTIARVCKNGILRTRDIALAEFQKSKGYLITST